MPWRSLLLLGLFAAVGGEGAVAQQTTVTHRCWVERTVAARAVAAGRPGRVAFAVVDSSGAVYGHRASVPVPSVSLLKTTILVAYLRRPQVRGRGLTERERRLLGGMIRRSDNDATATLLAALSPSALAGAARRTGQTGFVLRLPGWGSSSTTALDQARLMARISDAVPRRHRAYAFRLLATIVPQQRWGLAPVLPAGSRIWFKGGWGSGTGRVAHQAARIDSAGRVWTVAVLTENHPNHRAATDSIRRVGHVLMAGGPC